MEKLPSILGEEFRSINKIIKGVSYKGIGDDCAVIKHDCNSVTLYSMDAFIEDVHFKTSFFSMRDIGYKAAQASLSDIAAMGGEALYALISLSVPCSDMINEIMAGFKAPLKAFGIKLIGGDTTYADKISVSVCVIGRKKDRPVMRSGARPGDLIYITGYTGLASAGLFALIHGINGYSLLKKHQKRPSARLDISKKLGALAHSMIDISDGIASEITHICHQSNVSAELTGVPIHKELAKFCKNKKLNPETFALTGGEDYELLYTIGPKDKKKAIGFQIGRIVKKNSKPKKAGSYNLFKHF